MFVRAGREDGVTVWYQHAVTSSTFGNHMTASWRDARRGAAARGVNNRKHSNQAEFVFSLCEPTRYRFQAASHFIAATQRLT